MGDGTGPIERWESPEHGNTDHGGMPVATLKTVGGNDYICRYCGRDMVLVEYVRADVRQGAVDLLRQARGYIADHVAAHPGDRAAAELWMSIDEAIDAADRGQ